MGQPRPAPVSASAPLTEGDDVVLWARLGTGDPMALTELFDRHSRAVDNFAFRRTASWSSAEEITQATFLTLWRRAAAANLPVLEHPTALPWLLGVADRKDRGAYRGLLRRRRLQQRLDSVQPSEEYEADHADTVTQRLDDERRMADVRRAVRVLPGDPAGHLEGGPTMSNRLDLPPVRDLPGPARRAIRAELVRATRAPARRPRRWLVAAPVAAVAALVVVVLGVTQPEPTTGHPRRPHDRPQSAGRPGTVEGGQPLPVRPRPDDDGRRGPPARRTSTDGDVGLFTGRDGLSYACSSGGSSLYDGGGSKTTPLPEPSRRRPVVRIMAPGFGGSRSADGSASGETDAIYRVGPEVESLQLRMTVEGHVGPWFEASITDGYAWAGASLDYRTKTHGPLPRDYTVDDRAFDVAGHSLAIDRTPR